MPSKYFQGPELLTLDQKLKSGELLKQTLINFGVAEKEANEIAKHEITHALGDITGTGHYLIKTDILKNVTAVYYEPTGRQRTEGQQFVMLDAPPDKSEQDLRLLKNLQERR